MAGPAAVDQKRRAGGAQAGVGEPLEQGRGLEVEVPHVEVVDRVVERAEEAERAGRLERRAVLDVALLGPVVPVHPRDQVAVGPDPGGDLRGADRRHRGEATRRSRRPARRDRSASRTSARRRPRPRAASMSQRSESTTTRTSFRWGGQGRVCHYRVVPESEPRGTRGGPRPRRRCARGWGAPRAAGPPPGDRGAGAARGRRARPATSGWSATTGPDKGGRRRATRRRRSR